MADDLKVEILGKVEAQRKLEQVVADLRGQEFLDGMRNATLTVQRAARKNAPVDTGRLRASITAEVRNSPTTGAVQGVVGSVVEYAAAVELGSRPHWVPVSALQVWARRHGVNAYALAKAIAKRGTRPREYLQGAFDESQSTIVLNIGDVVSRIVSK